MKRGLCMITATSLVLLSPLMARETHSRASGPARENPWAPEHVNGLPPDVRKDVEGHAKACGNRPAAQHHFSLSIEASGRRFWAQHFEDFACERRKSVCRPEGCLHEVFTDDGRRQRPVFGVFARDITLTNDGGVAGILVRNDGGVRELVWNGYRFVEKKNMARGK